MRGEATALSDLDIMVLHPSVAQASRQGFVVQGVPVETFVQDDETLRWFLRADCQRGRPVLLNIVAEGRIIGPRPDAAAAWQARAKELLAAGPLPLSEQEVDQLRYEVTEKIDDLRDHRGHAEIIAVGASVYLSLADLGLRGRGCWSGSGKWSPRLLARADSELAARFASAFDRLFADRDPNPVIAFAEAELSLHGGLLFEAAQQFAPVTARLRADE